MPDDQQSFWGSPLSGITGFVANALNLNEEQNGSKDKQQKKQEKQIKDADEQVQFDIQKQISGKLNEATKDVNQFIDSKGLRPITNYLDENVINPANKYFQQSTLGQATDFLVGRPYRAIKGMAEPIADVYNGTMKISKGLTQFQNAGYMDSWGATKKVAGGIKDVIGGYMGFVPATFNLATGILPSLAAGKLGYQVLKSGKQSDTTRKLMQRREKRKKFEEKGVDAINRMKSNLVWEKVRNRNLEARVNEKRDGQIKGDIGNDQSKKNGKDGIYINVQRQDNPKAKDISAIHKKQIVRAQQQYNDLHKHI